MTHRWIDNEGHSWPITADWCTVCGLPFIIVDHHTTHPTCDLERTPHDPLHY